jgi:hypothetical protein
MLLYKTEVKEKFYDPVLRTGELYLEYHLFALFPEHELTTLIITYVTASEKYENSKELITTNLQLYSTLCMCLVSSFLLRKTMNHENEVKLKSSCLTSTIWPLLNYFYYFFKIIIPGAVVALVHICRILLLIV